MPPAVFRTHLFDRRLQIVEKLGVRKYVKILHIYRQLSYQFPDLLLFSGQHCFRVTAGLTVAPAFFLQKLQTLLIILAGDQLIDGAVGKQRHLQGTYPRNRIGILFSHFTPPIWLRLRKY